MLRWFESDIETTPGIAPLMVGDKVCKITPNGHLAITSELENVIIKSRTLVCFMSNGCFCTIEYTSSDINAYFSAREVQLPLSIFTKFAVVRNIDDPSLPIIHAELLTIPGSVENIITWNGVQTFKYYVTFDGEKFVYERRELPIFDIDYQSLIESVGGTCLRIIAFDEETHTVLITIDSEYYSVNVDDHSSNFMAYESLGKNLMLTTDPIIVGRFYD